MRVLDLFSGIGGFSLGLERAGMRTVAFCESDPFCQQVLRKHWPDVPIYPDIIGYEFDDITAELVCGGFPCQPYSHAGQREGESDDRALWPEMYRVICEVQPTWVIAENVTGIITLELDRVLSDLESGGYACQTFVIPAAGVGAFHRRARVWVIAHDPANADGGAAGQHTRELHRDEAEHGVWSTLYGDRPERVGADVSDTGRELLEGWRGRTAPSPAQWQAEPAVGRVADGVPRRMDRLRALGNAVVPQVVEEIGRAIMTLEESS